MKLQHLLALLCATSASCAALHAPTAPLRYGRADTRFGIRRTDTQLDDQDFDPVDRNDGVALTLDHVGASGHGFEILAGRTEEASGTSDVELEEISLGYRHRFGDESVSTFVGLGASYVDASIQLGGAANTDSSIGAYGQVGFHVEISQTAALEFGARGVFGTEVELATNELDVDYFQWFIGLTFGL